MADSRGTHSAWGGFIITMGVVFSVPVVAFMATGIINLFISNREGLEVGILLSIIALAVIWLAVMGGLWVVSGKPGRLPGDITGELDVQLAELQEENRRLREIVGNLSEALDNLSLPERQEESS